MGNEIIFAAKRLSVKLRFSAPFSRPECRGTVYLTLLKLSISGNPNIFLEEMKSRVSYHAGNQEGITAAQTGTPLHINPLTLRVSLEGIVCYFHTFENNLRIQQKFTEYLKDSCCSPYDQHFSFKYFQENAFVSKIFP